jgi:DNA-binding transcriptional regulator YiaG
MPQTLRSLDRLLRSDKAIDYIRIEFTRDTIRCEILRPEADIKPLIEHETARPAFDLYTSSAIDAAVYEYKKLTSTKLDTADKRTAAYLNNTEWRAGLIERLKNISDVQTIKKFDRYDLRTLRDALDMSLEAFARNIGCSVAAAYRWESGKASISNAFAVRILALMQERGLSWMDGRAMLDGPQLEEPIANEGAAPINEQSDWQPWPTGPEPE